MERQEEQEEGLLDNIKETSLKEQNANDDINEALNESALCGQITEEDQVLRRESDSALHLIDDPEFELLEAAKRESMQEFQKNLSQEEKDDIALKLALERSLQEN